MKTDLDHLPDRKQRELRHVVRVLFEEFEREIGLATQAWKKRGRILKVILYGSYARSDWVDDPVGGYKSDYDVLVVVNDAKLTDPVEYWGKADDRLMRDATINEALSAPVNFIVHDLADVNSQLTNGRPFFVDIANQGIALYEAEGFDLATPRVLPPEEAFAESKMHYEQWFPKAQKAFRTSQLQAAEGNTSEWRNEAAFSLHQATERFYHAVLQRGHQARSAGAFAHGVSPVTRADYDARSGETVDAAVPSFGPLILPRSGALRPARFVA